MKTNSLYALTAVDSRRRLFQSKLFVVSLILSLILASFPTVSVFAAGGSDRDITAEIDLEQGWKDKLNHLHWAGFYYDNVRFYPADFEKRSDLARVHEYLEKYGVALRAANTILYNHAGFDFEGNVTNEVQAARSVRDLAMYLHVMRGLRDKIDEVPSH